MTSLYDQFYTLQQSSNKVLLPIVLCAYRCEHCVHICAVCCVNTVTDTAVRRISV
jgi:hypothetical protein